MDTTEIMASLKTLSQVSFRNHYAVSGMGTVMLGSPGVQAQRTDLRTVEGTAFFFTGFSLLGFGTVNSCLCAA